MQEVTAVNVFFHYFLTVILRVCNFRLHYFHLYVCLPIFNSDPQMLFCLTYRQSRTFSRLFALSWWNSQSKELDFTKGFLKQLVAFRKGLCVFISLNLTIRETKNRSRCFATSVNNSWLLKKILKISVKRTNLQKWKFQLNFRQTFKHMEELNTNKRFDLTIREHF